MGLINDYEPPASLSPTRLSNYLKCPKLYEFSAVKRIPTPPTYAMLKGTFIHAVLEALFQNPPEYRTVDNAILSMGEISENVLTDQVKNDIKYDDELGRRLVFEATEQISTFFSSLPEEKNVEIAPNGIEVEVALILKEGTSEETPVNGKIDRIDIVGKDKLRIVDYKTGKSSHLSSKDDKRQLRFYKILIEQKGLGQVEIMRNVYTAEGTYFYAEVDRHAESLLIEQIVNAWKGIKRSLEEHSFEARPSKFNCGGCGYVDICEEGATWRKPKGENL